MLREHHERRAATALAAAHSSIPQPGPLAPGQSPAGLAARLQWQVGSARSHHGLPVFCFSVLFHTMVSQWGPLAHAMASQC
jgi:hypothetical protein